MLFLSLEISCGQFLRVDLMLLCWQRFVWYSFRLLNWRSLKLAQYVFEILKHKQNNAQIVCRFVFHSSSHYTINCGATACGYMFKGAETYVWRHFFRKLPRLVLDYRLYLFVVQVIKNSIASEHNEVCVRWKLKYTNLWDCYDAVWISAIALKFCHTIAESSWDLNDLE